ncbi:TIGR02680 family protein [Aureibacillus halotolerans]|uniref:Uncharacterized protein (TIGR02680 family) n=1 Tax=Aureibacillus halotolerans TaxID=1508390 RepID=A0A4R6TQ52_9BACI|nr:TIGR02680 family protein [Aureibacillus halotolerans]TDQ34637.1 uncharacterized protein (TIGR02680 family) [Aureibacillus halotolerans]
MRAEQRWQMNRAGLFNFWYYDEETFDFADGKLLLRGSNGSGKSVTMQSLLPVLLDGRKTPDRLDPFGSKARRMEDYLLGEKDVVNRDERTGYLFLEYKRKSTEQYITTGIGLQAKRHKPMKFWGFVITDNRRIGHHFELYNETTEGGERKKIPLSRIELENRIADGGTVVQTAEEYKNLVNRHIFGFQSSEAFDELIKLLIQIRSPKLSKEYKPTAIYDILEAALPALTDDDLRHLSDTIEQMDETRQHMEQLERELSALGKINQKYTQYNQRQLADQVSEFLKAKRRLAKEERELEELANNQSSLEQEITDLTASISTLDQQRETLEKQEHRLRSHKVWQMEKELAEEQQQLKERKHRVKQLQQKEEEKRRQELAAKERIRTLEAEGATVEHDAVRQLEDLEGSALEASFSGHANNAAAYNNDTAFDFMLWDQEASTHQAFLSEAEEALRLLEDEKGKAAAKRLELNDVQIAMEKKQDDKKAWLDTFDAEKEKQIELIRQWMDTSPQIQKEGEEAFRQSTRHVYQLFEEAEYNNVLQPFQKAIEPLVDAQKTTVAEMDVALKENGLKQNALTEELNAWKKKKDPEPERSPAVRASRSRLKDTGTAFEPLWATVEFQDDVPEEHRIRIEAALEDMGMLDALVTATDRVTVEHDRVLIPNPQLLSHTLADYLKPSLHADSSLPVERVANVLQSILIGDEGGGITSISESGAYEIGLEKGHALPLDHVRFIGRTARERYKQQQIAALQNDLDLLVDEARSLDERKVEAASLVKHLQSHLSRFPSGKDLVEIWRQLEKVQIELDQLNNRITDLANQSRALDKEVQARHQHIQSITEDHEIELTFAGYRAAKEAMIIYLRELQELKRLKSQLENVKQRSADVVIRLEELMEDVDELKGELNEEEDRVQRINLNVTQLEEQLQKAGADDIRRQIKQVMTDKTSTEQLLQTKRSDFSSKETELRYSKTSLGQKQKDVDFSQKFALLWTDTVRAEGKRGFVLPEEDWDDVDQVARTIGQAFGEAAKKDKSVVENQLTSAFYEQQTTLVEFRMQLFQHAADMPTWKNEALTEEQERLLEVWKEKASRRIVELDMRGQQVSPYVVEQKVEEHREQQKDILDEADRALYEEILFKSVGMKLRSRIQRAEKWAKDMDKLMGNRNISSGIVFSIRWRPRTADVEEEMDTRDLVHLLKQDANLLKEEDLDRITAHFRSKINRAKEWIEEQGEGQTLLQVLKEVLDYRKWFSFELSFQRTNEPVRELSNNQFFKFSGGEKALAMYIPLLTACYSRYQEASDHAPYIISLDEAFAGVDENNIREMFEVVEQLGFDYIMNSQVLWGDYDTVSALSVYELLRAKNAQFVSLLHYHWNGHRLAMKEDSPAFIQAET